MSNARNVHFERNRALGAINSKAFGAANGNDTSLRILLGAGLIYAGLGFPGGSEAIAGIKNILKFKKKQSAEYAAIAGGVALLGSSVVG